MRTWLRLRSTLDPIPAAMPSIGVNVNLLTVADTLQEKILEPTENVTTMWLPGLVVTKNIEVTPKLSLPYWSLAIPQTLISGWLLLSKHRRPNPFQNPLLESWASSSFMIWETPHRRRNGSVK